MVRAKALTIPGGARERSRSIDRADSSSIRICRGRRAAGGATDPPPTSCREPAAAAPAIPPDRGGPECSTSHAEHWREGRHPPSRFSPAEATRARQRPAPRLAREWLRPTLRQPSERRASTGRIPCGWILCASCLIRRRNRAESCANVSYLATQASATSCRRRAVSGKAPASNERRRTRPTTLHRTALGTAGDKRPDCMSLAQASVLTRILELRPFSSYPLSRDSGSTDLSASANPQEEIKNE